MKTLPVAITIAGSLFAAVQAQALTILLDYSHDAATDNFFATHPVARASLEQARNDLQAAISGTPAAIASDTTVGTSGTTTATYDFSHTYTNPSTGTPETLVDSTAPAGTVTIYVGMRELTGSTVGQGGPGGLAVTFGGSGVPAEWPATMDNANMLASAARLRGAGPRINTLTGTSDFGGFIGNLNVEYAPAVGNLWFDIDTDDSGTADLDAQLEAAWHFDAGTAVVAGKTDFYSVALHEMMHSIGVGTSSLWSDNISGADWLGAEAIALQGSGAGLINGPGHLANIMSPRISDGVLQEVVMATTITTGTRKTLTELDLAILRDLNWQTVPEPGAATLSLAVAAGLLMQRRRRA